MDAGPHPDVLARYINDHIDASRHNVKFVKLKSELRALVLATGPIRAGEEVFASYGAVYWKNRHRE